MAIHFFLHLYRCFYPFTAIYMHSYIVIQFYPFLALHCDHLTSLFGTKLLLTMTLQEMFRPKIFHFFFNNPIQSEILDITDITLDMMKFFLQQLFLWYETKVMMKNFADICSPGFAIKVCEWYGKCPIALILHPYLQIWLQFFEGYPECHY